MLGGYAEQVSLQIDNRIAGFRTKSSRIVLTRFVGRIVTIDRPRDSPAEMAADLKKTCRQHSAVRRRKQRGGIARVIGMSEDRAAIEIEQLHRRGAVL